MGIGAAGGGAAGAVASGAGAAAGLVLAGAAEKQEYSYKCKPPLKAYFFTDHLNSPLQKNTEAKRVPSSLINSY